jgi:hypothetical protein
MDDSKSTLATLLKTLKEQNASKAEVAPSDVNEPVKAQIEETKKQNDLVKKSEETLRRIEDAIKGNSEQLKVLPNNLADKLNVKLSDIKVPEQDKTTLESIKEFVGDTKSFFGKLSGGMGKGFNFVKDPMGAVKGGIEKVKEFGTKAQDTFYDIAETKAGYTAEEGRFVEEYKKQNRQFASGMTREEIESGKLTDQGTDLFRQKKDLEEKVKLKQADVDRSKKFGFDPTSEDKGELEALKSREEEIFSTKKINQEKQIELDKINQRLMEKANAGEFGDEESTQLQKKKKETQDQLFESIPKPGEEKLKDVEGKQTKNEEADNVVSAQESMADSLKENNEIIKDLLTTTKDQLDVVKNIRESLIPKGETDEQNNIQQKKEKFYGDVTTKLDEISGKLDNVGSGGGGSLLNNATDLLGGSKGKAPGKPGLGSRILGGLKSAGPGLLKGGLGAIGGMALGYGADKLVEAGHEKTGGALGVGAEALSGAGMGAMIGSVIPGVGTAIGGAVGGVAGGAYGLYKNWGNLFGGDKKQEVTSSGTGPKPEEIDERKLFGGLSKDQYQMAVGKSNGEYKVEMRDEKGDLITDEAKRIEYMRKSTNQLTKDQKESFKNNPTPRKEDIEGRMKGTKDIASRQVPTGEATEAEKTAMAKRNMDPNSPEDLRNYRAFQSTSAKPDKEALLTPAPARRTGADVATATTENTELNRETSRAKPSAPVIMNNSSSNNNTSYVPMKSTPRPEYTGSALDRYQSRISTY